MNRTTPFSAAGMMLTVADLCGLLSTVLNIQHEGHPWSPWYNHTGWLSIKYQGTCYLLSACFSVWVALPWELFAFKSDSIRSRLQNYRIQCTKMITTKHHPLNRLKAFNTSNHRWRVFTPYPLPAICQLHTHTHARTRSHTHTHTRKQTFVFSFLPYSFVICTL